MTELYHSRIIDSGQVALDSTGDKYSFVPGKPTRIYRVAVIATTAVTYGTGLTVKGDLQPTAGSATGRGDADVFEITSPAAFAQGEGIYKQVGTPGTPGAGAVAAVGGTTGFLVLPGQAVVFEVSAAMTAGDGHIVLHVDELPWQTSSPKTGFDWLVNMTEDTT